MTTLAPGQDATAEITGETPNLTLNLGIPEGQPGQDGVQLNDNAVNTTEAWSSKKIVDTLCPPFSVSGNPVTCNPVEGYPLGVTVTMEPIQSGAGDPSPDNVRPITGRNSVKVTVSNEDEIHDYDLILPETIYGGTVDAVTGVGSNEWRLFELNGETAINTVNELTNTARINIPIVTFPSKENIGYCNIFPWEFNFNLDSEHVYCNQTLCYVYVAKTKLTSIDVPGASAYLAAQYTAGTPVTVCYKLATPEPFQATGNQPIPALAGLNTVYTDGNSLAVSGRSDPLSTIQTMQAQITALQDQATQGGTA